MPITSVLRVAGLAIFALIVAVGCATAPTQEMSDARQAIQSARDAGAQKHAPEVLGSAEGLLAKAEQAIDDNQYEDARSDAVAAKKEAVKARNIALAIGAAEETLREAKSLGAEWRDSQRLLARARAAAKAGDEEKAVKLANMAKRQGEDAIAQYYLEAAKALLMEAYRFKGLMSTDLLADY